MLSGKLLEEVFKNALEINSKVLINHEDYDKKVHVRFLCDLILGRQLEHSSADIILLFSELKQCLSNPNCFSLKYLLLDQLKQLLESSNEFLKDFNYGMSDAQMLAWGYELKLNNKPSQCFYWSGISTMSREKWHVFFEAIKLSGIIAFQIPGTYIDSADEDKLLEILRQNNIRRCLNKETGSLKQYIFYSMFRHKDTIGNAIASSDPDKHVDLLNAFQQSFSELPGLTGAMGGAAPVRF